MPTSISAGQWGSGRNAMSAFMSKQFAAQPAGLSPLTSVVPTRHFQRSLPRLPVPSLGATLDNYLAAAAAVCTREELKKVEGLVEDFRSGSGRTVQEEILKIDKTNKHTSFVSYDYFERLLDSRDAIPFGCHRVVAVAPDERQTDMLTRATLWVSSTLEFYRLYIDNQLRPDCVADGEYCRQDWFMRTVALCPEYASAPFARLLSGGRFAPQDMSQFDNLFNTTRIPGILHDEIRAVGFLPHITVQHRGHQYTVTVADSECNAVSDAQIYARLRAIVEGRPLPAAAPVAAFTALRRSEWNTLRTSLLRNAANQRAMEDIDSSILVLNLDDDVSVDLFSPVGSSDRRLAAGAGTGRWWDKSLSVSVSANGQLSVTQEGSWGDRRVLRVYADLVARRSYAKAREASLDKAAAASEPVRQIRWQLPPDLAERARQSAQEFQRRAAGFRLYSTIVSGAAARPGLVPLASQMAWRSLHQTTVPCQEVLCLASFLRGRETTMHCTTTRSQQLTFHKSVEASLLREVVSEYNQRRAATAAGNSMANHFLALRSTSLRMFGRVPTLLQSPFHARIMDAGVRVEESAGTELQQAVSLSTTPTPNGYDVQCTPLPDQHLLVSISAWASGEAQFTPEEFSDALVAAMRTLDDTGLLRPT